MFRLPTGEEIRQLRKNRGLTQKQLANRAGVSQSLVAKIETGKVDPTMSTIRRISEALQVVEPTKAKDLMSYPVISVQAREMVSKAIKLMRQNDFSQLPVLLGREVVGSISETTILRQMTPSTASDEIMDTRIENVMDPSFPEVSAKETAAKVRRLLIKDQAVLVNKGNRVIGIITKIDALSAYLQGK